MLHMLKHFSASFFHYFDAKHFINIRLENVSRISTIFQNLSAKFL